MAQPQPDAYDASPFVPDTLSLPKLESASKACRGCPLYRSATQTVFGEGPSSAKIMLVGEQPGDQEDVAGKPFIGPAGKILDQALEEAEIPRVDVYVTNAVKHFKWIASPGGSTRRLHQRPKRVEILACRPWLEAEIEAVKPCLIVCLGATAAQSLLGSAFRITAQRGKPVYDTEWAEIVGATIHPSAVLRTRTSEERRKALSEMIEDLRKLKRALDESTEKPSGRIKML
jgi:DNA polymerase